MVSSTMMSSPTTRLAAALELLDEARKAAPVTVGG
jgi:hypothetical protein